MRIKEIIENVIYITIIIAILFIWAYSIVGPNIVGIAICMALEVAILAIGLLFAWVIFG